MNKYFEQIKGELENKSPVYIKIKVISKSPKNEIVEIMEDGTYKIRIAAQPVKGRANVELLKFIKKELGASDTAIVSGGRNNIKLIRITA